MTKPLQEIVDAVRADISAALSKNPPVEEVDADALELHDIPSAAAEKWYRIDDVVVVVADLQSSTRLGTGKHAASTAAIYGAATGNVVRVLHDFDCDFIAIQGDGAFGVFWGERHVERAICAGITIKTFSKETLVPQLESRWTSGPDTGFKVGVASGRVLVKNVGTRNDENEQEPIWAGKPVNYATKAAQQASRHELIVTGSMWLAIEGNDYLTVSCGHGVEKDDALSVLWEDVEIEKLTHDTDEAAGRLLKACWCTECGPSYVKAILDGETERPEAEDVVSKSDFANTIESARFNERRDSIARKRGLRRVKRRR